MGNESDGLALLIAVVITVALFLVLMPLGLLWALNTLGFAIGYGFWQWIAVMVLFAVVWLLIRSAQKDQSKGMNKAVDGLAKLLQMEHVALLLEAYSDRRGRKP